MRTAFIGSDNVARFLDGLTTTSLTVTFPRIRPEGSYDPFTRRTDLLPVGVSELTPVGVEDLVSEMRAGELITSPCGSGPTLVVDGRQVETSVTGTRGSIESLQPQSLTVCDAARGPARWPGTHPPGAVGRVAWSESPPRERSAPRDTAGTVVEARLTEDTPDRRVIAVGARTEPAVLSLLENVNRGWVAQLDGVDLLPVTVDGWHQGWVVPAGAAASVTLTFLPQGGYQAGLAGGLVLVVGLLFLALVPAPSDRRRPLRAGQPSRADRALFATTFLWLAGLAGGAVLAIAWAAGRLPRDRGGPSRWHVALDLAPSGLVLWAEQPWSFDRGARSTAMPVVACGRRRVSCSPWGWLCCRVQATSDRKRWTGRSMTTQLSQATARLTGSVKLRSSQK